LLNRARFSPARFFPEPDRHGEYSSRERRSIERAASQKIANFVLTGGGGMRAKRGIREETFPLSSDLADPSGTARDLFPAGKQATP